MEVNALTHPEVCPISLEPELKACAVQMSPIAAPQMSSAATVKSRFEAAQTIAIRTEIKV